MRAAVSFAVLLNLFLTTVAATAPFSAFASNKANINMSRNKESSGEIYNIPGSGWRSKSWNWGSALGTGHDCAMICRKRWGTKDDRKSLLDTLLNPPPCEPYISAEEADASREPPFEEVKLILGLAFQKGRRDGSDGGRGGYEDILALMARAERYETKDEDNNAMLFFKDLKAKFHLIASEEAKNEMEKLESQCGSDVDMMRRKSSSLVLSQMGFIDKGL